MVQGGDEKNSRGEAADPILPTPMLGVRN